jgi:hypothetical protein
MTDQTASISPPPAKQTSADVQPQKPELLGAYKLMLQYQFTGTVGLIVILAGILLTAFAATSTWTPPLLILVSMSGMLGAYFSSLTRLYNIDQLSVALITPTISQLGGRYLAMYSLMPPIIGAIAAVVLYVIFLAGMVGGGGLLPQMACLDGQKCDSLLGVLRSFGPKEAQDYGKVFVWAFAAGFSERLVPNTLQSLVSKLQSDDPQA